jgi:hypothetical protein
MSLRVVQAAPRRGLAWVSAAFALFLKRPLGFSMLFLMFLVAALILIALPYAGAVLVLAALPLLTLGFAIATRAAAAGEPVHAGQLIEPFMRRAERAQRMRLLRLCLLYALLTTLVMLAADAVDAGAFERLQVLLTGPRNDATNKEIDSLLLEPRLRNGLLIRFGLSALLSVPFWHAPMLLWWHGQGVAQSLFSSTLACWRNRGAFTLYGLAWCATVGAFGLASGLLFALLGMPQMLALAALPAGLLFSTAFYVSVYFTYVDCFAAAATDNPQAA